MKVDCRLIVFDRHGTLVDQEHFLLSLAMARRQGLTGMVGSCVGDLWEKAVGVDLKDERIDHNGPLATAPQREEMLIAASAVYQCGHSWSEAKRIVQVAYDQADELLKPSYGCVLLEGAADVLRQLRSNGLKLAIVTTDSHRRTEESLRFLSVARFFDVIIGGDDIRNAKPAPDMVLEACRQIGCAPDEAVIVGDSLSDVQMGKNAGVKRCVGVLTGFTSKEKLQELADVVVGSVKELRARARQT